MLNIEHKEDSTAKLEAVQGKPSKNFLFAEEVNQIVEEVNSIGSALNPDRIISLGTETIDGNECTYEGYTWQLGGVSVNNIGNPSVIVLPSATTGYKRNDISVFKADGTIERVAGTETNGEVATTPDVPEGTLYYKTYFINGETVEAEPEPPAVDGTIYKTKIENSRWKSFQSGTNVVIPFQAAGQMNYSVVNSGLVSVAGFSNSLLTSPLYEGQDVLFENQTGNSITLKNMFGSVSTKFNFGADLVVPNGGKLWLKVRNNEFELIMKSWADAIDLSTKADLVGGKVPASQLPAYVDDVLEFANLSAFPATGETGIIYLALDTNFTYRWSGSAYIQIGGRKRKHIFYIPLNTTIAASTSWYGLSREIGHILNPAVVIGVYNEISNTITEARVSKFRIPFGCKLTNTRWIHSTLSTALDVKIQYFEVSGGSSVNNITIASHQFPVNSGAADSVFSTQNNSFIMNENGYLTIVFFNNNVSTGALRSTLFEIEVEEI